MDNLDDNTVVFEFEDKPKTKKDTIITSNQYLRQGEFDKVVDYFMAKKNIDEQCMADLMFTWILANGSWGGKSSEIVSNVDKIGDGNDKE